MTDFLAGLIPSSLHVTSGFVTDSRGITVTPQIDLLVSDPSLLPPFVLSEKISVLPIESALMCLEIKTTLDVETKSQTSRQQEALRQLRYSWTAETRKYLVTTNCTGLPLFVFAFDSVVSLSTVKSWFANEKHLTAVCVVGKWLVLRNPRNDASIEVIETDADHAEVMQTIPILLAALSNSRQELIGLQKEVAPGVRPVFAPDIGAYVAFDVPDPTGATEERRI